MTAISAEWYDLGTLSKDHTMPTWAKMIPYLGTENLKNHIYHSTYLYTIKP